MGSVNSIDIVVATGIPSEKILVCPPQINLEEILKSINGRIPARLQECSAFSILGYCISDPKNARKSVGVFNCGCEELTEPHWQSLMSDNWILILCKPQRILYKGKKQIPFLHHVHQYGDFLFPVDVNIIIYEVPISGASHLSLNSWHSPKHVGLPLKKPRWVNELHRKPLLLDLDRVLLALNCSHIAKVLLGQAKRTFRSTVHIFFMSILLRLASMIWHTVAALVASVSTIMYIFLQCFHKPLSYGYMLVIVPKMFMHTWKSVHIRSCQFLYWPVILQGTGISSRSSVEYSQRAELRKHFMWSNILMDVIFGTILGILLLVNTEAICGCVFITAHQVTNDLLRSGCVWLMGVPARFKLNNELAEFIGMISLNAIQIFSTLWFFLGAFLQFYIQMLALLGIAFGLTVPLAVCIDMLKLVTLHIYVLHCLISCLYSKQIQALASLWRLFSGRKRNPLRQRLDSYDYTVEQHVVGSLLFTPLLLLVPTTSVFYIFLTSLITTIVFLCIIFEIIISLLHATPYAEILLWVTSRRRFPSGIWFRILNPNHVISDGAYSPACSRRQNNCFVDKGSESLVSLLFSNYATIGQVVRPYYVDVFSGVTPSFFTSLAHGILSGQRFPSTLGARLPHTMPWMQISCKEYWKLCYTAVLSIRS
ncbi:hypothetical protein Cni_G01785 [Canna indica]|uniref:N-acetylglucosaminyl transferase component n=1 Tax=Canna indica TaxID=4628 RepID=A0AAQ3JPW0_9LILI|nr:hypothetical protein Cni_G01785 [Canna indica]